MTEEAHPDGAGFADIRPEHLVSLGNDVDGLPFAVVGLSSDGLVEIYNARAVKLGGLPHQTVIGAHYFSAIAQCMNNFMVAQRLDDEPEIDAIIDYVLTLRMRPTPVRMRLLKGPYGPRRYILIQS